MRSRYVFLLTVVVLLMTACGGKPSKEDVAGQAAKLYYEALFKGQYEEFVDGCYFPDSIPGSYREQLLANAKMYVNQQQVDHQGVKSVKLLHTDLDETDHVANVFLELLYGDGEHEQILVPMVENQGVWYTR